MANTIEGIASPQSNFEKYKDMFEDKHDLITMDNFYSLLVAEMQNQDPLEPTSNTEFISQMASFTALSSQQDAFNVQQQNYANSLIGKTVTVSVGDGKTDTGVVTFVKSGEDPMVNVNGTNYKLSAISQVHSSEQQTSAIGDYGAFAAGILGKNAVVQSIDATGQTYVDEGTVSALEIEKGSVRVVVNGYAYNATDVLKVTENTAAQAAGTASAPASIAEEAAAASGTAAPADGQYTVSQNESDDAAVRQVQSVANTDDDDIADMEDNDDNDIYELFE